MVSNAELQKLITTFKEEFNSKYDGMIKVNEEATKGLSDKIDKFNERLDRMDKGFDDKIQELDAKLTESLTSVIQRVSQVETQLQSLHVDDLNAQILQLRADNEKLKQELLNQTNQQMADQNELREELENRTNRDVIE